MPAPADRDSRILALKREQPELSNYAIAAEVGRLILKLRENSNSDSIPNWNDTWLLELADKSGMGKSSAYNWWAAFTKAAHLSITPKQATDENRQAFFAWLEAQKQAEDAEKARARGGEPLHDGTVVQLARCARARGGEPLLPIGNVPTTDLCPRARGGEPDEDGALSADFPIYRKNLVPAPAWENLLRSEKSSLLKACARARVGENRQTCQQNPISV